LSDWNFAAKRSAMVDSQLRTSDVNDPAVIRAMAHVPREDYVPADRKDAAYIDRAIALGNGRALNPPLATGRLLTVAQINAGDKVLLIGGATGYTAAVLVAMGAQVTAVECEKALVNSAAVEGVRNVVGPLEKGAKADAPYDVLIIDGAVEQISDAIVTQLADDARVAVGIVDHGITRLCSGRKAAGMIGLARIGDLEMAVLPGFARAKEFVF
jgi:protein-L-isoaspartate(D-aspartate) O-methyltransferase